MSEFKLSWEHLNNSQLDLAINHLPSDKNLSRSELREKHHIISKVMIFKGLFSQALLKIHWSISQYGENISLEFDKASCYLYKKDYVNFELILKKIKSYLHDSIDQLKPENRFRSLILVGKMSELSGEISQSISYYKMAIQFAAQKELAIEAITQILRLNASFDEAINFNDYSDLNSLSYEELSREHQRNYLHSHLLSALTLLSDLEIEKKYLEFVSGANSTFGDKNLILFDILEYYLRKNKPVPNFIKLELESVSTTDSYELLLMDIYNNIAVSFDFLFQRNDKYSTLRILNLLKNNKHIDKSLFFNICFQILSKFHASDRLIWMKFIFNSKYFLQLDSESFELTVEKKIIDLSSSKMLFHFLKACLEKESLEDIQRQVWGENIFDNTYDRSKTIVARINKIFETSGLERPLSLEKTAIKLNSIYLLILK